MPDGNTTFFARGHDPRHSLHNRRMIVLPRKAEFLAQIAFADEDEPNAGNAFQYVAKIGDSLRVLDHQHYENFALWIQRPHICLAIILLLRKPPIPRCGDRRIAPDAGWLAKLRCLQAWIAACGDGIVGLFDCADVRPYDAVGP